MTSSVQGHGTAVRPIAAGAYLEVRNLTKAYGGVAVLRDISFSVSEGEFVCFLGPSGCGKTTLLLCLAGLESPTSGEMIKKGIRINDAPPSERDVGIVFQSYALFPNLDVSGNIGFGLVNQRKPRSEITATVRKLVALLSLSGHEHKYPSQLSGGQQQRVALARALAVSPSLLLLDEPLSALDAQVRTRLRGEIRDLQLRLGVTTIMVTHDQEEAQVLSDKIILMNQGRIEQIGTPWEIYNQPCNPFVADFMGASNLLSGRVTDASCIHVDGLGSVGCATALPQDQAVTALVRPEDIVLAPLHQDSKATIHAESGCRATIAKVDFLGPTVRLQVDLAHGMRLKVDVSKRKFNPAQLAVGQQVVVSIPPESIQLFAG